MAEYTNAEKADMILAYGATDCNGRAAQRLYAERLPVRRTPAHTMFARLHQQLCETGSFQKAAPSVLFTDEASFSREGIFNTPNSHSWAAANPHVTRTRAAQDRFLVNVWAGILGDHLIEPYILPDRLTGPRYQIFLEQVLAELLDSAHVTAATRTSMGFQQDGAPAHFSISVRNHLDATCGERWIGRGGPFRLASDDKYAKKWPQYTRGHYHELVAGFVESQAACGSWTAICSSCSKQNWGYGSPVVKVSDHGRYVMSSSPVPLKTRRVGERCTLNLSRAQTSSHWCGVVDRRGGASSSAVLLT
ncbi:uncharacterized protein TNCV_4897631 [Trichonephila clavipes]|nr:uncharacterized protein TNCV_4897631 [Trichonephila clavipes]